MLLVARSAAPKRISATRRAGVEAEPGQEAAAPVSIGELGRDVEGSVDVDDPVPAAGGPEHREVPSAALLDLEVEAWTTAAERADQLAHQALSLHPPDPGHDGEPGVQIEGEGVLASLDHQTFDAHDQGDRPPAADLKQNVGQTTQGERDEAGERGERGVRRGERGAELAGAPPATGRLRRTGATRSARPEARVKFEELAAGE